MKGKALLAALILSTSMFVSCSNNTDPETPQDTTNVEEGANNQDAVAAPSKATDTATLEKAVKESWIVLLENDVKTDKDIVLEGGFQKGTEPASRVLAMFKTDENKEVVASYTLTTPKLIVRDENAKIEGGTLKGDIYVEANGVKIEDVKIEGNVYFSKQEYKDSFNMDDKSTVSGVQEVK